MWRYDDIAIVIEIIRQGSFARAARKLNIPSSTVSRRVNELESALDIRLIERQGKKLALTEAGTCLFEHCSDAIDAINGQILALSEKHNAPVGTLRLTAPPLLGNEILNDAFFEFLSLYKDIQLDIELTSGYLNFINDNMDIAFRIGPLEDSDAIAQYLFSSYCIFCAHPEYIEQNGGKENMLKNFDTYRFLLLRKHEDNLQLTEKPTGKSLRLQAEKKILSNDISILRDAAIKKLGITYLPELCLQRQLASGELVKIVTDFSQGSRNDVYMVYPGKKYLSHKARLFIDFIRKRFDREFHPASL